MTSRRWIAVVVVLVASLFAVAAFVTAQSRQTVPLPESLVLSGTDVGFRVEGKQGNTPIGRIVVRIDGKWVEAQFSGGLAPVLTR
jgi:hypothetical protein